MSDCKTQEYLKHIPGILKRKMEFSIKLKDAIIVSLKPTVKDT